MNNPASNIITIKNSTAAVSVDTLGGAIIDFHLLADNVNPLTFKFPVSRMPENNRFCVHRQMGASINRRNRGRLARSWPGR
jgi:hypothetical protein